METRSRSKSLSLPSKFKAAVFERTITRSQTKKRCLLESNQEQASPAAVVEPMHSQIRTRRKPISYKSNAISPTKSPTVIINESDEEPRAKRQRCSPGCSLSSEIAGSIVSDSSNYCEKQREQLVEVAPEISREEKSFQTLWNEFLLYHR